jgi:hypothetical protein
LDALSAAAAIPPSAGNLRILGQQLQAHPGDRKGRNQPELAVAGKNRAKP